MTFTIHKYFLLLFLASAFLLASDYSEAARVSTNKRCLVLRTKASSHSRSKGCYNKGRKVTIRPGKKRNGYIPVTISGRRGYMSSKYVRTNTRARLSTKRKGLLRGFNIRKSPQGKTIANTRSGRFKLTGNTKSDHRGQTWHQVKTSRGKKGWVYKTAVTNRRSKMVQPPQKRRSTPSRRKSSKPKQTAQKKPIAPKRKSHNSPAGQADLAEPTTTSQAEKWIVNTQSTCLNIRETTAKKSKSLKCVPRGNLVNFIETDNQTGNHKVRVGATEGWVSPDFLRKASDKEVNQGGSFANNGKTGSEATGHDDGADLPLQTQHRPSKSSANCRFHRRPKVQKSCKETCQFGKDKVRARNCVKIHSMVARGKLPLKATLYSLKTWKQTTGKYCDRDTIRNKVRNKCSFMFTNLDAKHRGRTYQSPAYMVDLCVGDKRSPHKDVVNFTYTNRGKGSGTSRKNARYTDRSGRRTTIAGVFKTGKLRAFTPRGKGNRSRYRRRVGYRAGSKACRGTGNWGNGFLKNCAVIALNMSRIGGSHSGHDKPMHTSPYSSSSGCPSVSKGHSWMMRKLARGGVSLYIAYTSRKSESHLFRRPQRKCKRNGDSMRKTLAGNGN